MQTDAALANGSGGPWLVSVAEDCVEGLGQIAAWLKSGGASSVSQVSVA